MKPSTKKFVWKATKISWLLLGIVIFLVAIFIFIGIITGGLITILLLSIFLAWTIILFFAYLGITLVFFLIKFLIKFFKK